MIDFLHRCVILILVLPAEDLEVPAAPGHVEVAHLAPGPAGEQIGPDPGGLRHRLLDPIEAVVGTGPGGDGRRPEPELRQIVSQPVPLRRCCWPWRRRPCATARPTARGRGRRSWPAPHRAATSSSRSGSMPPGAPRGGSRTSPPFASGPARPERSARRCRTRRAAQRGPGAGHRRRGSAGDHRTGRRSQHPASSSSLPPRPCPRRPRRPVARASRPGDHRLRRPISVTGDPATIGSDGQSL